MPTRTPMRANTSFASTEVAELFAGYFEAKSGRDVDRVMSYYAGARTSHSDATLGLRYESWDAVGDLFAAYMPKWGKGASYGTQVLGDDRSAVVLMVNTPELFGGEIRTISAVDFADGKISRFVDYWDGRHFGASAVAYMRVPADEFPATFFEPELPDNATPEMHKLVERLVGRLRAPVASGAADLFAADAVLHDFALRIEVRGRRAIERFLRRADAGLPWGSKAEVRRVLGSHRGGGYEWVNADSRVARGISAIGLDGDGLIAELSTVWDGSLLGDRRLIALMQQAIEPQG